MEGYKRGTLINSINMEHTFEEHKKFAERLKIDRQHFFENCVEQQSKLEFILEQAEKYTTFLFSGEGNRRHLLRKRQSHHRR